MGQPPGGFPPDVIARVVRNQTVIDGRLEHTSTANMEEAAAEVTSLIGREATPQEVSSWLLYSRVFQDFAEHRQNTVMSWPCPHGFP